MGLQADQVAKPVCSVTTADGAQLEVKLENSKYRLEEDDTVIVGHVFPSTTTNATVNCDTSAVAQVGISHVKDWLSGHLLCDYLYPRRYCPGGGVDGWRAVPNYRRNYR